MSSVAVSRPSSITTIASAPGVGTPCPRAQTAGIRARFRTSCPSFTASSYLNSTTQIGQFSVAWSVAALCSVRGIAKSAADVVAW